MGKFGKKNSVQVDLCSYNIAIMGSSGVGKTTLAYQFCKKFAGEDGYIHFDIGRECGASAIEGIVTEPIEDWAKLMDVVNDIVENKTTDYKNLRMVILDTLDELFVLAEKETIRMWNKKNPDKRVDTISAAYSGFGRGQDKAIELVLDMIWELKKVNVNSIIISHIRRTDIVDTFSQDTYSQITADMSQKYFNAVKNKCHFIALAYNDIGIATEKLGRKDIKGKDLTTNKVVSESRILSFRDPVYAVDSKSRFADIVERTEFSVDGLATAMTDAIMKEKAKSGMSEKEIKAEQTARDKAAAKAAAEYSKSAKSNKIDLDRNEEIIAEVKAKFADATEETQLAVKAKMKEVGLSNFRDAEVPTEALEAVLKVLG